MANAKLPRDDELIPRLLDHDEFAYKQVVHAYHANMVHVARAIVGEAFADEVAQEAWIAVFRALPKFERRSSLKTWIMRIVGNCAKSRLRKESRTVNYGDTPPEIYAIDPAKFTEKGGWELPPSVWHADTPDALLASSQLRDCINKTLKTLPPQQQAVISLRDMEGLDTEVICNILEISETNLRVLLHRARSRIREAIDDYERYNLNAKL